MMKFMGQQCVKGLTRVIAEDNTIILNKRNSRQRNNKACRQGSRGKKDQLLIDNTVLKDCKKKHTSLSMARIDYKRAHNFVSHSWINKCRELFRIVDNARNFLEKKMDQWKLSLTPNVEVLWDVDVKRRIFQWRQSSTTVVCFEYGTFAVDT